MVEFELIYSRHLNVTIGNFADRDRMEGKLQPLALQEQEREGKGH